MINKFGIPIIIAECKNSGRSPDYYKVYFGFPQSIGERKNKKFVLLNNAIAFAHTIEKLTGKLSKQEIYIDYFYK